MKALPPHIDFFFPSSCRFTAKLSRVQRVPTKPLPPHRQRPPHSLYLASQRHPCYNWWNYTDIIFIPSPHCTSWGFLHYVVCSMGFDKCKMTCTHHYLIIQSGFTTPQILQAPHIHVSLPKPPGNNRKFYCLCSFAFSRMSYGWNHTGCSLFRLASST